MHHKSQQQLDVPYVLPPQMIFSNSKEFINMKKLLFAAAFVFCFVLIASADDPSGTFTGFTTIKVSGQLDEDMLNSLKYVRELHIFKEDHGPGFFTLPISLDRAKKGYEIKNPDIKISYKDKGGKFSYADKWPWAVVLALIEESDMFITVMEKGGVKCSGTIEGLDVSYFDEYYSIGLNDGHPNSEDLCGMIFPMEEKGKNFVFAQKDPDANIKITVKSNGKVSISMKLSEKYVSPKFLIEED